MPPRKKGKANAPMTVARSKDSEQGPTTRAMFRGHIGDSKIQNLPLDVLLEIFRYLEPQELLYLARTSKSFASFLLNLNNSGLIWKAALRNAADPPKCPPWYKELAWINVMFSPHCHDCLEYGADEILWEFGTRYCTGCIEKHIAKYSSVYGLLPPRIKPGRSKRPEYIAGFEEGQMVHIPELMEFHDTWSKTPRYRRSAMVQDRKNRTRWMLELAKDGRQWLNRLEWEHRQDAALLISNRLDNVILKLNELGWGEEMQKLTPRNLNDLKNHPLVYGVERLTDDAWLAIRDPVVEFMEGCKAARLLQERRDFFKARLQAFKAALNLYHSSSPLRRRKPSDPDYTTIANFPEVRSIMELPAAVTVTDKSFDPVIEALPKLIAEWHADIKMQLGQKLRTDYKKNAQRQPKVMHALGEIQAIRLDDSVSDSDLVDLAIAVFRCSECDEALTYPTMIAHFGCSSTPSPQLDDPYLDALVYVTGRDPWTPACVQGGCDIAILNVIRRMIETCGLDWKKATGREMDERPERFFCASGLETRAMVKTPLNWRRVIQHCFFGPHQFYELIFKPLRPEETEIAKKTEEIAKYELTLREREKGHWECALCVPRLGSGANVDTWNAIRMHLSQVHHIAADDIQAADMYLNPNSKVSLDTIECRKLPR